MACKLVLWCCTWYVSIIVAESCRANIYYCGHESAARNMGGKNNTLYQCSTDETTIHWTENCTIACRIDENSYCECQPGTLHCGSQLHSRRFSDLKPNALYHCSSSGHPDYQETCNGRCIVSMPSYCSDNCIVGKKYCGSDLGLLQGWSPGDVKTVYRCHIGGNSTEKVTSCRGRCMDGRCTEDCGPNTYYCGYELTRQEYSNVKHDSLYQCNSNGHTVSWIQDCTVSCQFAGQSYCACQPQISYCGSQLHSRRFSDLKPNALYTCSSSGHPNYQETCNGRCIVSMPSYCFDNCTVGEEYCGSDLGLLKGWNYGDIKAVYRCEPSGNSTVKVKECRYQCVNGSCSEDCVANGYYCGHKLIAKGYSNVKNNSLYQCSSDGQNVSWIEDCTVSCQDVERAYCTGCMPNVDYCGRQLRTKGFPNLISNALYHCSSSGYPEYDETCSGSCLVSSPSRCIQNCTVGQKYCGRELNLLENWSVLPSEMDYLFTCTTSSSVTSRVCPEGCVSGMNPYCRENCVPGVNYCGPDLAKFEGWSPHVAKSVHRCRADGQDANYVKLCRGNCVNGDCIEHCSIGKYYCGYELNKLESWSVTAERHNYLYNCIDGLEVDIASECSRATCLSTGDQPHCSCVQSFVYCGSELLSLGYKGLSNNTLYLCKNGELLDQIETCQKKCIASKVNSSCENTCVHEKYYCGSKSPSIGHHANHLYRCILGNLVWRRKCSRRCITGEAGTSYCAAECEPRRLYCGHELEKTGFTVSRSNNIYLCRNRTSIVFNETCNIKCETGQRAYCSEQCIPGLLHCGHELREAGAKRNSLYLCTASKTVTEVLECSSICIVGRPNSTCASADLVMDVPNCGTLYSTYIGNGGTPKQDGYPWMVSLRNGSALHYCGGLLIHPQWILTAAHCVKGKIGMLNSIIIGEFNLQEYDKGQENVSVAEVFPYPAYNSRVMQSGDLALVLLSKQVTSSPFVRPVCLPQDVNDTVQPNTRCVVVGWGAIQCGDNVGNTSTPNEMQHGKLKVFDHKTCADEFKRGKSNTDYTYNSSVMICAGPGDTGDAVPCKGDSGGPLLCRKSDDASWVVHGIVSYGRETYKGTDSRPYVFTNVATFVAWIQKTISNDSTRGDNGATSAIDYFKMSADADGFEAPKYEIATPMPDSDRFGAMAEPSNTLTVSPYEQYPETVAIPSNETVHHSVGSNSQSVGSK